MKYITNIVVIFTALILSGCASTSVRVAEELRIAASQGKSGMVFCSLGGDFLNQSLYFRAVGSAAQGWLSHNKDFFHISHDIKEGKDRAGIVFARLPPGDYELVDVSFFTRRGVHGATDYRSKRKFSIPFTVTENEVIYLGAFMSHMTKGRNFLGLPVDTGGYYVIADHFERDLTLLKIKEASVEGMASKKMVVDPDAVQLPIFQSKRLLP